MARRDDTESRELGIIMTSDIALKADWRKLTDAIYNVLAGGIATIFGLPSGPTQSVGGIVKAITALEVREDPGERAWQLLVLCFSWALNEMRSELAIDLGQQKQLAQDIVALAKQKVSTSKCVLPANFVKRPTDVPLYKELRDEFIRRRGQLRGDVDETEDALRFKFDSAFRIALFEIWARKSDLLSPVVTALDSRFSNSALFEVQWEAYRERLIHNFHVRPVSARKRRKYPSPSSIFL